MTLLTDIIWLLILDGKIIKFIKQNLRVPVPLVLFEIPVYDPWDSILPDF